MKDLKCPACGETIPADSKYCDMCGVELLECINCGTIGINQFCSECGQVMIARDIENMRTSNDAQSFSVADVETTQGAMRRNSKDNGAAPDVDVTQGRQRRRSIALQALNGGCILYPKDEAIIGRRDGPYEKELSELNLISRRHGKFIKQGREWSIVDFGSTNGTLVNDVELEPNVPMRFKVGDIIDIGTYLFKVVEL